MATWRALAKTLEVSISELLGEAPLPQDPAALAVIKAMERLPIEQKAALVAAANAMAQQLESPTQPT